ncbi:MAG TPA: acyl carrier protein [Acidimicrobiales bacterium]
MPTPSSAHHPTAASLDPDRILEGMRLMIAEVIGEGYDLDLDITRDTSFAEDIEIESIEFVAFGELLRETYDERVDLVAWFGEMDVDQIIALTVGEVVDYVVRCTS